MAWWTNIEVLAKVLHQRRQGFHLQLAFQPQIPALWTRIEVCLAFQYGHADVQKVTQEECSWFE